jgi:hypothetical protein
MVRMTVGDQYEKQQAPINCLPRWDIPMKAYLYWIDSR